MPEVLARSDELPLVTDVAVADADGDGVMDIVVNVGFLRGLGQGSFSALQEFVLVDSLYNKLEVVPRFGASADIYLVGGYAVARVRDTKLDWSAHGIYFQELAVGDFDCDGAPDVASISGQRGLEIFRGDQSGGLASESVVLGAFEGPGPRVGDLDGDGTVDLVGIAQGETPEILLWLSSR